MAAPSSNPNYSTSLLTTTFDKRLKGIVDNFFDNHALFFWLKNKAREGYIKKNGGSVIATMLLHDENDTGLFYDDFDVLDITPQEGISAADYAWRNLAISIVISRTEERKNSGKEQAADLLNSKMEQARMSIFKKFNDALWSARVAGDKQIESFLDAIQTVTSSNPAAGAFGNIDQTAAVGAFWKNVTNTGVKTTTAFDNLIAVMRTTYNSCSIRGGAKDFRPDFAVTDQAVFEGYEGLLEDRHRILDTTVGDAGFDNLKYKGMTVFWDDDAEAGTLRMINSNFLQVCVDTETDFIMDPFVEPVNQKVKIGKMLWMGNLIVRRRDKLGVVHSIT